MKFVKVLLMTMLFALMALPVHAWSYDYGYKTYCGLDGCYRIDDVRSVRYYDVYGDNYRYKYYNGPKDYDIDINIDIDCHGNCKDNYKYRNYYYMPYDDNTRIVRYAEYTYPYNHRVVRTGYPYYTTTRYPYW